MSDRSNLTPLGRQVAAHRPLPEILLFAEGGDAAALNDADWKHLVDEQTRLEALLERVVAARRKIPGRRPDGKERAICTN